MEPRTPYAVVSAVERTRAVSKRELVRLSRQLELAALSSPPQVVAAALQDSRFLTDRTRSAYERIASAGTTVTLLARGLQGWLAPGVRGVDLAEDDPLVDVLAADWSTLLDKGPFSLLFLVSGQPNEVGVEAVADLVEEGGLVVLDDFTPCEIWPPISGGRVDTLREEWLTDKRFTTVEVMVASDAATLIATVAIGARRMLRSPTCHVSSSLTGRANVPFRYRTRSRTRSWMRS